MGLGKKIGIGIGIAVAALFVLAAIGYYYSGYNSLTDEANSGEQVASNIEATDQSQLSQDASSDSQPSETTTSLATKSLQDIMPARDDIGTRWRIGTQSNSTDGLEDVEGVVQALQQGYTASKDGFNHLVTIALIKFESTQDADAFYNARITQVYEEGGYEEYIVNASNDAKCYGTFRSLSTTDHINFYCLKSNIYYRIQAFASPVFLDDIQGEINDLPKIIADKI